MYTVRFTERGVEEYVFLLPLYHDRFYVPLTLFSKAEKTGAQPVMRLFTATEEFWNAYPKPYGVSGIDLLVQNSFLEKSFHPLVSRTVAVLAPPKYIDKLFRLWVGASKDGCADVRAVFENKEKYVEYMYENEGPLVPMGLFEENMTSSDVLKYNLPNPTFSL